MSREYDRRRRTGAGWTRLPAAADLQPLKGELITCTAWVAGEDGEHLIGKCQIPNRPFSIVATGRDQRGLPFRRIESRLHSPR